LYAYIKIIICFFSIILGIALGFIPIIHFVFNKQIVIDEYNGNAISIQCLIACIILEYHAVKLLTRVLVTSANNGK